MVTQKEAFQIICILKVVVGSLQKYVVCICFLGDEPQPPLPQVINARPLPCASRHTCLRAKTIPGRDA